MFELIQPWMHHCVWETPSGDLLDITPQLNARKEVEFPPEIEFRKDETATLLVFGDRYRARLTQYTALKQSDKTRKVIQCLGQADQLMQESDLDGEKFWLNRAAKLIHRDAWIAPKGMPYRLFELPAI